MNTSSGSTPNGQNVADSPLYKKILGQAGDYVKKPLRVKKLLNDSYKKATEKKNIGQIAADVWESMQILFRLLTAAVSGKYHGIPTGTLLGGTAVLLYFMSPIDAIPDFIPIIGLLDDAALLGWFMTSIKDEMDRFGDWERTNGPGQFEPTAKPKAATATRRASSSGDHSADLVGDGDGR